MPRKSCSFKSRVEIEVAIFKRDTLKSLFVKVGANWSVLGLVPIGNDDGSLPTIFLFELSIYLPIFSKFSF